MNPGILTSSYRPPPMPYNLLGRPIPMPTVHGRIFNPYAYVLVYDTSREPANNTISIQFNVGGNVDVTIDWGDSTTSRVTRLTVNTIVTKTYSQPGVYMVQIAGTMVQTPGFSAVGTTSFNRPKLVQCLSFGNTGLTSLINMFRGNANLTIAPSTLPPGITSMSNMFADAFSFNQPIGHWDTSSVTNMNSVFGRTLGGPGSSFNQPIGSWNTSSVTTMANMFNANLSFRQPLHTWNISSVTSMSSMFANAGSVWGRANYDAALIAWSQQDVRTNVSWGVGTNQYSAGDAAAARAVLVSKGWIITDGGQAP